MENYIKLKKTYKLWTIYNNVSTLIQHAKAAAREILLFLFKTWLVSIAFYKFNMCCMYHITQDQMYIIIFINTNKNKLRGVSVIVIIKTTSLVFPINSFIMLWDNIYKPYSASWWQHALKTWQNISFFIIVKKQQSSSSSAAAEACFSDFINTFTMNLEPAVQLCKKIRSPIKYSMIKTSVKVLKSGVFIHVITPKRKSTIIHTVSVD